MCLQEKQEVVLRARERVSYLFLTSSHAYRPRCRPAPAAGGRRWAVWSGPGGRSRWSGPPGGGVGGGGGGGGGGCRPASEPPPARRPPRGSAGACSSAGPRCSPEAGGGGAGGGGPGPPEPDPGSLEGWEGQLGNARPWWGT